MSRGAWNKRLTLQEPQDAPSSDFDDVETVWGSLTTVTPTGPEQLRGGAPTAIGAWVAQTHYRTDVRAEWRVTDVETGRVFQISSYGDETGRRSELTLYLTEIQ